MAAAPSGDTGSGGRSEADDAMCVVCLERPASAGFVHGDRYAVPCGEVFLSVSGLVFAFALLKMVLMDHQSACFPEFHFHG